MVVLTALIAIVGVAFTVFACSRMLVALRGNAPRDLVMGWMALMVLGAVVVFGLLRFL